MLFQYRRDSISVRERVVLASRKFRRSGLILPERATDSLRCTRETYPTYRTAYGYEHFR
jgi:hypothetical protein